MVARGLKPAATIERPASGTEVLSFRKPALGKGRLESLDERGMAVDGNDGAAREFGQVQRLSADAATQVPHRRRRRQTAAQTEGSCGTCPVARTLPGQGFDDLEEDLPETRCEFVPASCSPLMISPSSSPRVPETAVRENDHPSDHEAGEEPPWIVRGTEQPRPVNARHAPRRLIRSTRGSVRITSTSPAPDGSPVGSHTLYWALFGSTDSGTSPMVKRPSSSENPLP